MASRTLLLLPGDGIGPEAMGEVKKLIAVMNAELDGNFTLDEGLVGGSAYDAHGQAISEADMAKAMAADAVLFGAVGGPKWDKVPYEVRPEAGLLGCARTWRCSPISGRRSATRRSPPPRR